MACTIFVDLYIRIKGRLIPPIAILFRWNGPGILTSMSRLSIVPSINEFRLPKFDFEAWSSRSSVYSQGTNENEKALVDFNKCMSESAEDWSSVCPCTHQLYVFLTYYIGQEVVRRQHLLPHCPQLSHCLLTSRRSCFLHRRLFSRHKPTRICPSHIRILDWLRIRTPNIQSSERDVRSKDYNDHNLRWIHCFHAWLRHGPYVAGAPSISLPRGTLCRRALYFGWRNLCRSLFERCSSGIGDNGAYDSE